MGMRADIRSQLLASAAVTAIVGSGDAARCWWMQIPQEHPQKPALTFRIVAAPRIPTLEGNSDTHLGTLEVVAWGADVAVVEALADAAVDALLAGPVAAVQTAETDIIETREGLAGGLPGIVLEFTIGHSTEE